MAHDETTANLMLESDPLITFHETIHRYQYGDHWMINSVTRVIDDLTAEARERIAATKDGPDGWEIRGNTVHAALEQHLLKLAGRDVAPIEFDERWTPWIEPMVNHWIWDGCTVEAVELRLCDPQKSLGGSLDFIIKDENGRRILADAKSVSSAKAVETRKPADQQLGGYLQMLIDSHQYGVEQCGTLVVGPGVTRMKPSNPDDCLAAWLDAWMKFDAQQPDF